MPTFYIARRKALADLSVSQQSPSSFKVPINTSQPLRLKSIQTSKGIVEVPDMLVNTSQWEYINKESISRQQASPISAVFSKNTQCNTTAPEVHDSQKVQPEVKSMRIKRKIAQQNDRPTIPLKKQKFASIIDANGEPNTGKAVARSQNLSTFNFKVKLQTIEETPSRRKATTKKKNSQQKNLRNVPKDKKERGTR